MTAILLPVGQQVKAASVPVVFPSDTDVIPIYQGYAPTTAGLTTLYRNLSLTATGVNIVGSAKRLRAAYVHNRSGATLYFKLWDKATAPTVGTDTPAMTCDVPAGVAGVIRFFDKLFSNGIGIAVTTALADSDVGAPAANDFVLGWFLYQT